MAFKDRAEAGRRLAEELKPLVSTPCVVAGIPRGGVAVALPVARALGCPLTVVYARKLTSPIAPELAFGALDEDGESLIDERTVAMLGLRPGDVESARQRVAKEIRRRMDLYGMPPLARYLPEATAVLVDDGLATGLTMRAALRYARRHHATRLIVAVPCASGEASRRFRAEADRLVSLIVDENFYAVGAYYEDFSPVSDEAVIAMLMRARETVSRSPTDPTRMLVSFKNAHGRRLSGVLLLPASGGPHPLAVFAHGWGSGKGSPRNRAVAEALLVAGFGAFLFDFTGHGESEGVPEESTLGQQAEDLRAALDAVETFDDVDASRIGVVGASSGAAVAILQATSDARIRALVLRSPNPEGAEWAIPRVKVPTVLVVGEHDEPIRILNEELAVRFGGRCQVAVVPKGDHLFEDPWALDQAARLTVGWLAEHLG